ncbi:MAG: diacylglycerol kinase family lipid kinase [Ignavibacteriaceae bacterium]|nr:diacylglycerol kinase family lipid kinase [Ignavibacteriaceae bacterium]
MKTVLLVNPVSGKGYTKKILPEIENKLSALGINHSVVFSEKPKHFFHEFPKLDLAETDFITVVGGDGFMNEIVNGFSERAKNPFLLIPAGSGNDIGRSLDISVRKFLEISDFKIFRKQFDVLELTYNSFPDGSLIKRKFLSSCGAGFDAEVSKLSSENKVLRGLILYLYSTLKALLKFKQYRGKVLYGEGEITGDFTLITTGNTSTAGGGFKLTPHAVIDDGLADIMIAGKCSRAKLLQILPLAIIGKHIHRPEVTYIRTQFLKLTTENNVPLHSDGEFLSASANNIEIHLFPEKITFIVY